MVITHLLRTASFIRFVALYYLKNTSESTNKIPAYSKYLANTCLSTCSSLRLSCHFISVCSSSTTTKKTLKSCLIGKCISNKTFSLVKRWAFVPKSNVFLKRRLFISLCQVIRHPAVIMTPRSNNGSQRYLPSPFLLISLWQRKCPNEAAVGS